MRSLVFAALLPSLLAACDASPPAATATPTPAPFRTVQGAQWLAMPFDQQVAWSDQALRAFMHCPSAITANDVAVYVTRQITSNPGTDTVSVLLPFALSNGCVAGKP